MCRCGGAARPAVCLIAYLLDQNGFVSARRRHPVRQGIGQRAHQVNAHAADRARQQRLADFEAPGAHRIEGRGVIAEPHHKVAAAPLDKNVYIALAAVVAVQNYIGERLVYRDRQIRKGLSLQPGLARRPADEFPYVRKTFEPRLYQQMKRPVQNESTAADTSPSTTSTNFSNPSVLISLRISSEGLRSLRCRPPSPSWWVA